MAAAADSNSQAVRFRHLHRGDHVGDIAALSDQGRPAIDHAVVNLPSLVVSCVFRRKHSPAELAPKLGDGFLQGHRSPPPEGADITFAPYTSTLIGEPF